MGLFSGLKHIVGGLTGATAAHAANHAAQAQQEAIQRAIGQYNTDYSGQQNLWNPYINFGAGAMGGINALNSGDYSGFENSPDYQYALQQGLAGVNSQAGKMGNLFSGARATALDQKAQGLATQNLGNYRNSLFNQLNYGQNATNALSNQLWNKTQGVANAQMGIGNAQAGGMIGAANAYTNAAGNMLNFGSNFVNPLSSLFKGATGSGYQPSGGYQSMMPSLNLPDTSKYHF